MLDNGSLKLDNNCVGRVRKEVIYENFNDTAGASHQFINLSRNNYQMIL